MTFLLCVSHFGSLKSQLVVSNLHKACFLPAVCIFPYGCEAARDGKGKAVQVTSVQAALSSLFSGAEGTVPDARQEGPNSHPQPPAQRRPLCL